MQPYFDGVKQLITLNLHKVIGNCNHWAHVTFILAKKIYFNFDIAYAIYPFLLSVAQPYSACLLALFFSLCNIVQTCPKCGTPKNLCSPWGTFTIYRRPWFRLFSVLENIPKIHNSWSIPRLFAIYLKKIALKRFKSDFLWHTVLPQY